VPPRPTRTTSSRISRLAVDAGELLAVDADLAAEEHELPQGRHRDALP
jgi:hypothetical protein